MIAKLRKKVANNGRKEEFIDICGTQTTRR